MKNNDIDYIIYLMKKFTKSDTKKPRKKQGEIGEQDAAAASGGAWTRAARPRCSSPRSSR